jgi:hypothetical protein
MTPDEPYYTRPNLSEEQKREITNAVARIRRMGFQKTLIYLFNALLENAVLLAEVNEHRRNMGIQTLPTYKPNVQP